METQVTSQAAGFDKSAHFKFRITSGGIKIVIATFGDDAWWCERTRKQRMIKNIIGRGKSQYDATGTEKADFDLWQKLKQEGSAELDEYEASKAVGKLESVDVLNVETSPDSFRVTIQALGYEMVHELRIPTQKQLTEYSRAAIHVYDARRSQEIRSALEPAGTLYDALVVHVDGYAGPVPIVHKSAILSEVAAAIDAAEQGDNSF